MKYLLFILSFCIGSTYAQSPSQGVIKIDAGYLSMYLKAKSGVRNWEKMRPMPAGNFLCRELKNGDLMIRYNRNDTAELYPLKTAVYKDRLEKFPVKIAGFKLKGVYGSPDQYEEYQYLMYVSKSRPNSLLMIFTVNMGEHILGVTYYSDKPENPMSEKKVHFEMK